MVSERDSGGDVVVHRFGFNIDREAQSAAVFFSDFLPNPEGQSIKNRKPHTVMPRLTCRVGPDFLT